MKPLAFRPRALLALAAACAFAMLAAVPRDAGAANAAVSINNFAFSPGSVTVGIGDTVTWTNNQAGVPHTVTSDTAGVMDSGTLASGATYAKTFDAAGTFTYFCAIHPTMTGTVIVTAAEATATATTAAPTATTAAATATPTAAATSTAAATATATTAAATATQPAATATPTRASTAPAGTPTTQAPAPPATGTDDGGDGGGALLPVAGIGLLAVVGGAAAWAMSRRRRAA